MTVIQAAALFRRSPSDAELINTAVRDATIAWERAAAESKLNEHIFAELGGRLKPGETPLYDLNACSRLERRCACSLVMVPPGAEEAKFGWIARVELRGASICSPSMASEASARLFTLIAWLRAFRVLPKAPRARV